MLVVYDRGTEHVEALYEYNKLTAGTISPRMTVCNSQSHCLLPSAF
jgi:hypothetical protein